MKNAGLLAGARKTVILKKLLFYGICLTGLENNYKKNDVESKDLASFFFYLKIIEITEVLP